MSRWLAATGVLAVLVATSPLQAQGDLFRWLAFGDSITLGNYDPQGIGYPGRLSDLLGCGPGVCEVFNAGKSGEKTFQGVSRIDDVLEDDGPFDVMMLMEGTNDIFREYSVESAVYNLRVIAQKARNDGTGTVHASIIWFHPDGTFGTTKDDEVEELRDGMEDLAAAHSRYFVDIWDVLCPASHPDVHNHTQNQCFNMHYADACPGSPPPCGDNRGHPIGSGYTMMADAFFDGLTAVPVPGVVEPTYPIGTIDNEQPSFVWLRESPLRATWYRLVVESDAGVVVDKWVEAFYFCGATECARQLALNEALEDGDYSWRVRARNPAGLGAWSKDTEVTIFQDGIFSDGFESGDTGAWVVFE